MDEIWLLGASGRSGRAIAAELGTRGCRVVLVGRDRTALDAVAQAVLPGARIEIAHSVAEIVALLRTARPAVVINTIGPFTHTALPIAQACAPGVHYVDVANELDVTLALLARHDEPQTQRRAIVTGAGFGVLASESVVLRLCRDCARAARVRVDSLARVEQAGVIGPTVAATVVDALPAGGRVYRDGRLRRTGAGTHALQLVLPDGSSATTASAPFGELEAARRASGAADVVAASAEMPTGLGVRLGVPLLAPLLAIPALRAYATRKIAALPNPPPRRAASWARAHVTWPDGATAEGWLKTGEAYGFLARVCVEVACRLAAGEGRPGAFTPGALFGFEIAQASGGEFVDA